MKKPFFLSFAITCAAMLAANPAKAQDVSGTVVVGAAAIADHEGAKTYQVIPLLNGRVMVGQRYLEIEGVTARMNIVADDRFEFGPVANLTFGRDAKTKALPVARLGVVKDAYEVGAFAAFSTPVGDSGRARLSVQAVHDVSDVHKGWVATARAGYTADIGKVTLGADVSASYASVDYMRTYFGVTAAGATASGLPRFTAGAGFKDVGANVSASYRFSKRWSLQAVGGYKRLIGDAADSPIVDRAGDANQLFGAVGIGFSF